MYLIWFLLLDWKLYTRKKETSFVIPNSTMKWSRFIRYFLLLCRAHPCLSWNCRELWLQRISWRLFSPALCSEQVQINQVVRVVLVWGLNIYEDEIPQPKSAPVPKPDCSHGENKRSHNIWSELAVLQFVSIAFHSVHAGSCLLYTRAPELLSTQAAPAVLLDGAIPFQVQNLNCV